MEDKEDMKGRQRTGGDTGSKNETAELWWAGKGRAEDGRERKSRGEEAEDEWK